MQRRIKKEQVTATKPFEKGFQIYAAPKVRSVSIKAVHTHQITPFFVLLYYHLNEMTVHTQYTCNFIKCEIIQHATCTCVSGKCGACNHTAALMFCTIVQEYQVQLVVQAAHHCLQSGLYHLGHQRELKLYRKCRYIQTYMIRFLHPLKKVNLLFLPPLQK